MWIVAALATATCVILAALLLEHLGGLAPCPLCYQQRYAYYAGIPVLIAAYLAVNREFGLLTVVLLAAVCLAFLGNAGIGVYHAGVEWEALGGSDDMQFGGWRVEANHRQPSELVEIHSGGTLR